MLGSKLETPSKLQKLDIKVEEEDKTNYKIK